MPDTHPTSVLAALGLSDGLVQLAIDVEGEPRAQRFIRAGDAAALKAVVDDFIRRNRTRPSGVLFGVNARARARGRDEDVTACSAMVFDFDKQKVADRELLFRLADAVPPSVLVASGSTGNAHVYWTFEQPVAADVARSLMRRVCRHVGADASWPPSKMMRLPGSLNWKNGEARSIAATDINPEARTTPEAFSAALDALGFPPDRESAAHRVAVQLGSPVHLSMEDLEELMGLLPPWTRDLIVRGQPGDRYKSRSEADLAVAGRLVEAGATDDEIHAVFAMHPDGIGSRLMERGESDLARTIGKARGGADLVAAEFISVAGTPDRMAVELHVLDGEQRGLRFTQGVEVASSAWPWVFKRAEVPLPATIEDRQALLGRVVGVKLGKSSEGLWQVNRWAASPP
ncbi:MAG: hypothetical protein RL199_2082 [Pseudomonadota bacterium]|jgi:hypothetical protein